MVISRNFLFFRMQKRPERSADGTWIDHQTWTKLVMAPMLGLVVYYSIMNRHSSHETPLAKMSEFLEEKRSQASLCAPSYKREIESLGNTSKCEKF